MHRFPVAIAAEPHPFPFRTRKLSPPAPMVLGGRPPGRVGRRRIFSREEAPSGASSRVYPERAGANAEARPGVMAKVRPCRLAANGGVWRGEAPATSTRRSARSATGAMTDVAALPAGRAPPSVGNGGRLDATNADRT